MSSNRNRDKGHDLERQVARDLKVIFPFTKTSRAASRLADDCAIDLVYSPFLIQCKAGYNRNRPKYEEEYAKVNERIKVNFPKDHIIHKLPFLLIHKPNAPRGQGLKEQFTQVTMSYDFFNWMLHSLSKDVTDTMPLLSV